MSVTLRHWLRRLYYRTPVLKEVCEIRDELRSANDSLRSIQACAMTRLVEFDFARHPRYADPRRLLASAFQVSSQNGEDGILMEIFRRIGATDRRFVEIGVGNGRENNTAFLVSQGWTGVWVDCDAGFTEVLSRARVAPSVVTPVVSYVTPENAAAIIQNAGVPAEFDLLSIDTDQSTPHIWEALGAFRPRAVVVEYNAMIPPSIAWTTRYQPERAWDGRQNWGASLKALELIGDRLGYSLVGCEFVGVNAFFVRNDLVGEHFAAPFTAENHYEPPRYGLRFRWGHASEILDRPS
jgi:hypothetical protein